MWKIATPAPMVRFSLLKLAITGLSDDGGIFVCTEAEIAFSLALLESGVEALLPMSPKGWA